MPSLPTVLIIVSCYFPLSLVFAALFAGWGFGLFGEVSLIEALALGLIAIAAMILWSRAWIDRFGEGPFERLLCAAANLFA